MEAPLLGYRGVDQRPVLRREVSQRRPTDSTYEREAKAAPAILVVEDDLDVCRMYAEYLRAKGCAVFTAIDGASAIEKGTGLVPDVIVLDLKMPRVDGWTALDRLKASSWTVRIPVIVVSGVEEARDEALRAGCDAYLAKPCLPDVLWLQTQALLRRRIV